MWHQTIGHSPGTPDENIYVDAYGTRFAHIVDGKKCWEEPRYFGILFTMMNCYSPGFVLLSVS